MENNMKRLLCLLSSMDAGGAETFLMKIYRSMDHDKYQMDFCVNVTEKCFYEDEILKLGGKMFRIPQRTKSFSQHRKQLKKIIRDNGYEYVLAVTSSSLSFLDMKLCKKENVRVRAVRSSNSQGPKVLFADQLHSFFRRFYQKYVNIKIAPSDLAAQYLFGERAVKNNEIKYIHNGVDLDAFKYSESDRAEIRKSFGIEDDELVLGHVGRFFHQKNHSYLIDVFHEVHKKMPKSRLMLVGSGPLEAQLHSKAEALGLGDRVCFTGVRDDVNKILSAMDIFVFPSLFEGMPNTVVEAQANGLPCIISDTITKEVNITGSVKFLPINGEASEWADSIISCSLCRVENAGDIFMAKGYDIAGCADVFVNTIFENCL